MQYIVVFNIYMLNLYKIRYTIIIKTYIIVKIVIKICTKKIVKWENIMPSKLKKGNHWLYYHWLYIKYIPIAIAIATYSINFWYLYIISNCMELIVINLMSKK